MAKILEFKKKEDVMPIDIILSIPAFIAGSRVSRALLKDIATCHKMGPITMLGCDLISASTGLILYSRAVSTTTMIRKSIVNVINVFNNLDEEEEDGGSET